MPTSPPPCREDDNEATHDNKFSEERAPQSPQHYRNGDTHNSETDSAMLLVMAGGTRLVSRPEEAVTGDRHAFRDSPPSTSASIIIVMARSSIPNPTFTAPSRRPTCSDEESKANHHVAVCETEPQKNDTIMSQHISTTEQVPVGVNSQLNQPSSVQPSAETSATSPPEHPTLIPLLLPPLLNRLNEEVVEASITAAVAKIANTKTHAQFSSNLVGNKKSVKGSLKDDTDSEESSLDTMSVGDKLIPTKNVSRKRSPQVKTGQSTGRWTHEEHQTFLQGLGTCGREWKKVASLIPTRSSAQIRSHAQKYFSKVQKEDDASTSGREVHTSCNEALSIPTDTSVSQLLPSVQQNVERILANPAAVEREVGDTLQALRERYRQLQQRLEQQQQQRRTNRRTRGCIVEEDDDDESMGPYVDVETRRRKRFLDEDGDTHTACSSRAYSNCDDHSSVSSGVSASWHPRDLENEELIALHVLGGSLPRGDSSLYTGAVQDASMGDVDSRSVQDTVMEECNEQHLQSSPDDGSQGSESVASNGSAAKRARSTQD